MIEVKINKNELEKAFDINVDGFKLNEVTAIISDDIKRNLNESTLLDGKNPSPLNPQYKRFKAKHWGHTDIFWGKTGLLRKSVTVSSFVDKSIITIANNRYKIANWIVSGTSKMPSRDFFGISRRALVKIDFYLNKIISKVA